MTNKDLRILALHAAKGTAPANFSAGEVDIDQAVADGFRAKCTSLIEFERNKLDIYEIITAVADEIVPKDVRSQLGIFADVEVLPQGKTKKFTRRLGRNRAKMFLTTAALSGVYETFRLDKTSFEIGMNAIGGAGRIDFERMLDGQETMGEIMEIISESLVESVLNEVQKALISAATDMSNLNQATNYTAMTGFNATEMQKLVNVARAYGPSVAIFATPEFITDMGADAIVPGIAGTAQGVYSPDDIDSIHKTGFIQIFRGTPIVPIQQSFVDETNTTTWINPQFAYILPAGQEKVVKIIMEGQTQMYDHKNRDNSYEIHFYKKMGVGILTYHNWCIAQNTSITDTSYLNK